MSAKDRHGGLTIHPPDKNDTPIVFDLWYAELLQRGDPVHFWWARGEQQPCHNHPLGRKWEAINYLTTRAPKDAALHGLLRETNKLTMEVLLESRN